MLRKWDYHVHLQLDRGKPLAKQVAAFIVKEIQKGRLIPGMPLPGSRTLASDIHVNRKTITNVYEELTAQGWLESREKSGTFVSNKLPVDTPRYFSKDKRTRIKYPEKLPFQINKSLKLIKNEPHSTSHIVIDDGFPDVRLAPVKSLGTVYKRVMEIRGRRNLLGYSSPLGHPKLREEVAIMLNKDRGLAISAQNICITRGSQMGLYLIANLIINAGDYVAMEDPGYPEARAVFNFFGATVVPIDVDKDGLNTNQLELLLLKHKIKAVFLTPHHQYPTTATLQADRRIKLLQLAKDHEFAIIEDDYDQEFHFTRQPVLPMASADREGNVIYTGSMSKLLAPSVRVGYIVAPQAFIDQLGQLRSIIDKQGDPILEQAVAELIEDGEIKRHTRKAHSEYLLRRNTLGLLLKQYFGDLVSFEMPAGGLAIWIWFDKKYSLKMLHGSSSHIKVPSTSSFYYDNRRRNALRFGFASKDVLELEEAVKGLKQSLSKH